jgi:hypothetical protein
MDKHRTAIHEAGHLFLHVLRTPRPPYQLHHRIDLQSELTLIADVTLSVTSAHLSSSFFGETSIARSLIHSSSAGRV